MGYWSPSMSSSDESAMDELLLAGDTLSLLLLQTNDDSVNDPDWWESVDAARKRWSRAALAVDPVDAEEDR
jgi:hypothetical protein